MNGMNGMSGMNGMNGMNGMSVACAAQMGPHKITDQIEECCICLENKKMIMLEDSY
jgi:hypothetical protein